MNISSFATNALQTIKGIAKILLLSRRCTVQRLPRQHPLIILANGPSLNDTLQNHSQTLQQADLLAVNFGAISPHFHVLRPKYYVLADPLFFSENVTSDNMEKLRRAMAAVCWPIILFVPTRTKNRSILPEIRNNPNIAIQRFNAVGVEGFGWFRNLAYRLNLGMPRPRNVLIPSIMCGMAAGYSKIIITGADHSWMQTIAVDDQNRIVSVQPHFYKDTATEQQRVNTEYAGYRLHQIVYSFYIAFRAYHLIAEYARHRGIQILNATPQSFIDAFPRTTLDKPI